MARWFYIHHHTKRSTRDMEFCQSARVWRYFLSKYLHITIPNPSLVPSLFIYYDDYFVYGVVYIGARAVRKTQTLLIICNLSESRVGRVRAPLSVDVSIEARPFVGERFALANTNTRKGWVCLCVRWPPSGVCEVASNDDKRRSERYPFFFFLLRPRVRCTQSYVIYILRLR